MKLIYALIAVVHWQGGGDSVLVMDFDLTFEDCRDELAVVIQTKAPNVEYSCVLETRTNTITED